MAVGRLVTKTIRPPLVFMTFSDQKVSLEAHVVPLTRAAAAAAAGTRQQNARDALVESDKSAQSGYLRGSKCPEHLNKLLKSLFLWRKLQEQTMTKRENKKGRGAHQTPTDLGLPQPPSAAGGYHQGLVFFHDSAETHFSQGEGEGTRILQPNRYYSNIKGNDQRQSTFWMN